MNKFLLSALTFLTFAAVVAGERRDELEFPQPEINYRATVFAAAKLGSIAVTHDASKGFSVNGKTVPPHLVDKSLRDRSPEEIRKFLAHNYLKVKQGSDQNYSIEAGTRNLGGGAGGATVGAFIGKWGTTIIGNGLVTGLCQLSNFVAPGSGIWVETVVRPAVMPVIEAASIKVAIAGGVLGGVLTGPV